MTGRIESLTDHHAIIRSDEDDQKYWMYRINLDRFGPKFEDLQRTMRVRFTPVVSDRQKDGPIALEVKVIGPALSI